MKKEIKAWDVNEVVRAYAIAALYNYYDGNRYAWKGRGYCSSLRYARCHLYLERCLDAIWTGHISRHKVRGIMGGGKLDPNTSVTRETVAFVWERIPDNANFSRHAADLMEGAYNVFGPKIKEYLSGDLT